MTGENGGTGMHWPCCRDGHCTGCLPPLDERVEASIKEYQDAAPATLCTCRGMLHPWCKKAYEAWQESIRP